MFGGTPKQCLDAGSLALSNLLGLVCDPIAGLVEAPCQNRNSIGATNALICAQQALAGIKALIPFDEMVEEIKKSKCSYRMAAYIIALKRLIHTEEIKGIFP